jgi:hypothetical protein
LNIYEEIEQQAKNSNSLEESLMILEKLLSENFSIWTDGSLYSTRQLVERIDGLRIEVFSREHAPPHFHISGGGINAEFTIAECKLLKGKIGKREKDIVKWWYKRSKPIIILAWNEARPSDCPIGKIRE